MHNGRTDIQSVVVFIVDSLAGLDRVRRFPEEILLTMLFGFYVQRSAAMIGLGFLVDYLMTLLRSGLPPVPYTSDTGVWTDDDQRTLGLPDLPSPRLNIVFFGSHRVPHPRGLSSPSNLVNATFFADGGYYLRRGRTGYRGDAHIRTLGTNRVVARSCKA